MTPAIVLFFLLSGLLWLAPLISDPMGVLFWRGGAYSDLLISHWPNAVFVRRSLAEWGQVPLWNPMILSGAPFAADPLSGLHYPPNWLSIVIDPALAFNLLAWIHVAWGGLGMWIFARQRGIAAGSAVVAGLAFAGMPKAIGHIGLGHVSLVYAVYWTPWILLAFERAIADLRWRSASLAGAGLGLVFLIDPRWYLPLGVLAAAYSVWRLAEGSRLIAPRPSEVESNRQPSSVRAPASPQARYWGRYAARLVGAALMSLAIAAILAAPMAEFVSLSTRADLSLEQATEFSLPPSYLIDVLSPEYAGWPEWQVYAGAVVLYLALAAVISRAPGRWFWVGVVLVALLLALGELTPIYRIAVAAIPGYGRLRVPPRSLFVAAFALAFLGTLGLNQILKKAARSAQLWALGVGLAVLTLGIGLFDWLNDPVALRLSAHLISAALIVLSTIWAVVSVRIPLRRAIVGWGLLIFLDLSLVNLSTLEVRPAPETMSDRFLVADRARVFSPSYSLPQPGASAAALELADGINPIQLAAYADFMSTATGFDRRAYSVTLPPFPEGDPQAEWGFRPDPERLGWLAISHIVSSYPVTAPDLEFEGLEGGRYHYANPGVRPRAWMDSGAPIELLEWTPNKIELLATGPGTLVASEIAYPGWQVAIDGKQAKLLTYEGLLRAVELPAGVHQVSLSFRPLSFGAGAIVTLLGLAVLASLWIRR